MSRHSRSRSTLLLLVVSLLSGCFGPPQIGVDRDSFKAVDALYTAVSLRDAKLVAQSEERLRGLHDAGKLPQASYSAFRAHDG